MNLDLINTFIKFVGINITLCFSYFRIINHQQYSILKNIIIFTISVVLAFIESIVTPDVSSVVRITISYIVYCFILGYYSNIHFSKSLIITTLSVCFSYIAYFISSLFASMLLAFAPHIDYKSPIISLLLIIIQMIIILLFFRMKRFKNGIPFFKIENTNNKKYFINSCILILNIILIFLYLGMKNPSNFSLKYFTMSFCLLLIALFAIFIEAFILYHKQKLQTQALKDYEKELSETKQKLETAINEKQKLVKSNHEFYHRQEALNKKLDDLMRQQTSLNSSEFGEEYANVLDRINSLSNEYSIKIKSLPTLIKTNIVEIDDMLSYMQSECEKNNIEFILKVDCDLNFILENYISKSQLETLLGDLIRNAIIAIDYSSNDYKSIMVIFGIKDEAYELCIFDSGIPFEINTLLNLGLQPASTHTNEGGTGIGFITTFETINSCNASFIINENTNSNYSKSIEIKFDNKHEYIIISDRKEKITELNQSNRKIILK